MSQRVAVIGGGAAGFFAAIQVKTNYPEAEVHLLEKSNKVLSKVRISGGGRCNVTSGLTSISDLSKSYPRGGKQIKKLLPVFSTKDTWDWFKKERVDLYTQDDGRVFPTTDDSGTIVSTLINKFNRLGCKLHTQAPVHELIPMGGKFKLSGTADYGIFNQVIIATGGSPKRSGFDWLEKLGHKIVDPVPSLFTFNLPKDPIRELQGVAVPEATVSIRKTKLEARGPLLITHWGLSGPAVLKLSAFGARILNEMNYEYDVKVNWTGAENEDAVRSKIKEIQKENPKKKVENVNPHSLPTRLWSFLLDKAEVNTSKPWAELSKKEINKLCQVLSNDSYSAKGKTTFKEEFVTCGGVSLESVNMKTMESKVLPGLHFAGEVLNIDGITGGFNFQAAWTTGFVAGRLE
jgi:predicted Rossmann fold flavoprotein